MKSEVAVKESRTIPNSLMKYENFTRQEFEKAMKDSYNLTTPQVSYDLKKQLEQGLIVRSGWAQYSFSKKRKYSFEYSEQTLNIVNLLSNEFEGLEFQIFELRQLNDFMNHQMAHNTIFVSVENELIKFVFDALWRAFPGKVLLKPKVGDYYRYKQDDEIVINRLPSESPKGYEQSWQSRLEKILVDVFTDKLISEIVPEGEKKTIIDGAFEEYLLDVKTMVRYAKRKGAEKKFAQILEEYGKVTS